MSSLIHTLIKAWEHGEKMVRYIIVLIIIMVGLAIVLWLFNRLTDYSHDVMGKIATSLLVTAALFGFIVQNYENFLEERSVRTKIQSVEKQVRENPEKPQLAWELAQTKLESYLNRNLAQVKSIFWLTVIVMLVGFGFILYGVVRAFDAPDKLPVAIVASASGVLVSFIGGSFLIVYRSILAQSRDYVSVLERINAVGMAVQVLETIPQENAQLKYTTTAEVAKQLLRLYSSPVPNETSEKTGG